MIAQRMSERELQAFADKLEAFGQALTAKEQMLLRDILVRAALADEDDVHAHGMIVDPIIDQHAQRLSGPFPWYELHHQIQAVILHLGKLHNLLSSPFPRGHVRR